MTIVISEAEGHFLTWHHASLLNVQKQRERAAGEEREKGQNTEEPAFTRG